MQGVHEEEGIHSFSEWMEPVFHGEAALRQLVTSYRNTVEIMTLGQPGGRPPPVEGQLEARPVLRHGEVPRAYPCRDEKERIQRIAALAKQWQEEGYHTVAVIEKTKARAEATWAGAEKAAARAATGRGGHRLRRGPAGAPCGLGQGAGI